ncbi:RNA methyltransferase substrate-binding domain-containing protein, partial [Anaerostipes hadrus]
MKQVMELARERKVAVQFVPKKRIDQVADGAHQGVLALVAAYRYAETGDMFKLAKERNEHPFILILDELEDPHNLGSIL